MSVIRDAVTRLKDAQKPSTGAPAYSRYVNRPLGRLLAAVAYALRLSPTQVTLVSGTVTMAGIVLIALLPPNVGTALLVTALLVLGYALDAADGQLSRLTGTSSLSGEWLDHFVDALKAATIHLAVFVSWWRFFDLDAAWLAVPLVFGAVGSVFFLGVVLADLLRRINRLSHPELPAPPAASRTSAIYSLAVAPADYGVLCVVFLALWAHPVFVGIYTALAVVNLLLLPASAVRWFRSLRRIENRAV